MSFTGFPDEALAFYEGLQADNSRTYFTRHREVYDRSVKAPMQALLDELAGEFGEGKLFRPNRDVRFSNDKSPYKTHQGAFCDLDPGIGFYVSIDADGIVTAGGFHSPEREQTMRYRTAVDDDVLGDLLVGILGKLTKAGFKRGGAQVKTRPRGCPADHPRLELMRHQSLTVHRRYLPDDEMHSPRMLASIRRDWKAMRPLLDWIDQNVGPA